MSMAIGLPGRPGRKDIDLPSEIDLPSTSLTLLGAVKAAPRTIVTATVLARIGGSMVVRGATWATRGGVSTATEIAREVASGSPIMEVVDRQIETFRWGALQILGIEDSADDHSGPSLRSRHTPEDLRARGDRLLRSSADAVRSENEHPAFARILDELLPDEARIMRFMAKAGRQPSIDVRTKTPFNVGSERVKGGINLIAEMAGCTYPERGNDYLGNLGRLGLILFSAESVEDQRRYSFLEAQPVTAEALASVRKAYTVYRSISISGFGKHFVDVCFSVEDYDAGGWVRDVR
ncbi:MAG: Abi-alpha family protein [Nocardioides sp.]|uniref:Abi-alpha family protein n=1 Tax=Nocardioides sp. TaxID=35761 RepID=UPI0039E2E842